MLSVVTGTVSTVHLLWHNFYKKLHLYGTAVRLLITGKIRLPKVEHPKVWRSRYAKRGWISKICPVK